MNIVPVFQTLDGRKPSSFFILAICHPFSVNLCNIMHVTNGEEISSLGLLVQFDNVNPVSGIGVQFTRTLVQFPSDAVKSKKRRATQVPYPLHYQRPLPLMTSAIGKSKLVAMEDKVILANKSWCLWKKCESSNKKCNGNIDQQGEGKGRPQVQSNLINQVWKQP